MQRVLPDGAGLGMMGPRVRGGVAAVARAAARAVDPLQPARREMGRQLADGTGGGGRVALLGAGGGGEVGGGHGARVHHIARRGEVGGLGGRVRRVGGGGRGEAGVSRVLDVPMDDGRLAVVAVGSRGGGFAFQCRRIMGGGGGGGEFRDGGLGGVRPRVGVAGGGQGPAAEREMLARLAQLRVGRERGGSVSVSRGVRHAVGTLSVESQVGSCTSVSQGGLEGRSGLEAECRVRLATRAGETQNNERTMGNVRSIPWLARGASRVTWVLQTEIGWKGSSAAWMGGRRLSGRGRGSE
jgi:hypothetical protein